MWNDNETEQDLIDFKYLTNSVNLIINNEDLIPSTIGVYGDWGSGKSSLMKMIELENTNPENLIIKFNGWLFEGYEDAKIALLSTLIDEIIKSRTWNEKAKKYLGRLVKRIQWLKLITKTAQIGINGFITSQTDFDYQNTIKDISELNIDDYIKEVVDENQTLIDKGIREFNKDFEELLEQTELKRVIVLIDDLDRCNPDTIISTLEAIKLFLFVKKSVFVISADERLINYAVKKRFPELPSTDYDVSKDYIEKLIHFPIRIPSLSESEYETYVNLLFAKLHLSSTDFENLRLAVFQPKENIDLSACKLNNENISHLIATVPENLKSDFIISKQINSILVSVLSGNPRQCKRFLNMLMMRLTMSSSKGVSLKKNVLAKLMLLEYFKTETFNKLVKSSYETDDNLLSALEEPNKNTPKSFEGWTTDVWLKKWLDIEPKLGDENLKLYFYFTKNKNVEFSTNKRLSEEAKLILRDLFAGDLVSKNAITKSSQLSAADLNAIFSELTNKFIIEEDVTKRALTSKHLMQFVKSNSGLISEYCAFMENVSEDILLPAAIPNLLALTKDTPFADYANSILEKWSKSNNSILAKATKTKIRQNGDIKSK
jgi:hypothetical protein